MKKKRAKHLHRDDYGTIFIASNLEPNRGCNLEYEVCAGELHIRVSSADLEIKLIYENQNRKDTAIVWSRWKEGT